MWLQRDAFKQGLSPSDCCCCLLLSLLLLLLLLLMMLASGLSLHITYCLYLMFAIWQIYYARIWDAPNGTTVSFIAFIMQLQRSRSRCRSRSRSRRRLTHAQHSVTHMNICLCVCEYVWQQCDVCAACHSLTLIAILIYNKTH